MNGGIKYKFSAVTWQYGSPAGWYFVSLPKELAIEIKQNHGWQEEGWGRLKVIASIDLTEWETAIWFDTKNDTYLLPLKAEIRKKHGIESGKNVELILSI